MTPPLGIDAGELTMNKSTWSLGVMWFLVWLAAGLVWAAGSDAELVVRQATEEVYRALDQQCELLQRQPEYLYELVDNVLMPHADMERMSQWVLGKYWREANEDQRREFIEQFRLLLVRTYATALELASLKDISYLPVRYSSRPDRAVVRTEINRPGSETVALNYLLYKKDSRWLVYDIQVDGVSLVNNYRTTFAEEIRREGFSVLLSSLQQKNRELLGKDAVDENTGRKSANCGSAEP